MTTPTTVEEALEQTALNPKQAMVGKTQITSQDLDALMKVADRAASATATTRNHCGLVFRQIVPPGSVQ